MITAERPLIDATESPRPRPARDLDRLTPGEAQTVSEAATDDPDAVRIPGNDSTPAHNDGTGLLVTFVVATGVMVVGVVALTMWLSWWLLAVVVAVHWIATYVILSSINGLLEQ